MCRGSSPLLQHMIQNGYELFLSLHIYIYIQHIPYKSLYTWGFIYLHSCSWTGRGPQVPATLCWETCIQFSACVCITFHASRFKVIAGKTKREKVKKSHDQTVKGKQMVMIFAIHSDLTYSCARTHERNETISRLVSALQPPIQHSWCICHTRAYIPEAPSICTFHAELCFRTASNYSVTVAETEPVS